MNMTAVYTSVCKTDEELSVWDKVLHWNYFLIIWISFDIMMDDFQSLTDQVYKIHRLF